mmetsp:Transcript_34228/g.55491  ORF Transcript_34228/g.55491 Transcript_34228/m.55491 type:complete len:484 (-) Transcript_34228:169-1620(-)
MTTTRSALEPLFPTDEDLLDALPHLRMKKRPVSRGANTTTTRTFRQTTTSSSGFSFTARKSPRRQLKGGGGDSKKATWSSNLRSEASINDFMDENRTGAETYALKLAEHGRTLEVAKRQLVREVELVHRRLKEWERNTPANQASGRDIKASLQKAILHWGGWAAHLQNHSVALKDVLAKMNDEAKQIETRRHLEGDADLMKEQLQANKALVLELAGIASELQSLTRPYHTKDGPEDCEEDVLAKIDEMLLNCAIYADDDDDDDEDNNATAIVPKAGRQDSNEARTCMTALKELVACLAATTSTVRERLIPQVLEAKRIADLVNRSQEEGTSFLEGKMAGSALRRKCESLEAEIKALKDSSSEKLRAKQEAHLHLTVADSRIRHLQEAMKKMSEENLRNEKLVRQLRSSNTGLMTENARLKAKMEASHYRQQELEKHAQEANEGMEAMRRELVTMARLAMKPKGAAANTKEKNSNKDYGQRRWG